MCVRTYTSTTKTPNYLITRSSRYSFLFFIQDLILHKSYTLRFRQNLYHSFRSTLKSLRALTLLNYIYINKSFYILKVYFQFPKEILGQARINKEEYYNIINRIAKRDNNSNIINKQEFKKILNMYNKQIDEHSLIYYIK